MKLRKNMWYNSDCEYYEYKPLKKSTLHLGAGSPEPNCKIGMMQSGGCPRRCKLAKSRQ